MKISLYLEESDFVYLGKEYFVSYWLITGVFTVGDVVGEELKQKIEEEYLKARVNPDFEFWRRVFSVQVYGGDYLFFLSGKNKRITIEDRSCYREIDGDAAEIFKTMFWKELIKQS